VQSHAGMNRSDFRELQGFDGQARLVLVGVGAGSISARQDPPRGLLDPLEALITLWWVSVGS
jgi:hypothetical protein